MINTHLYPIIQLSIIRRKTSLAHSLLLTAQVAVSFRWEAGMIEAPLSGPHTYAVDSLVEWMSLCCPPTKAGVCWGEQGTRICECCDGLMGERVEGSFGKGGGSSMGGDRRGGW